MLTIKNLPTDTIKIDYQLTFASPFHFGTGLRKGMVHRAVALDHAGYVYVPGSTVKGALRNEVMQLCAVLELPYLNPHSRADQLGELFDEWSVTTHLFGTRACPGSLCFDDLALTQDGQALFDRQPGDASLQALQTQTRTQVSLSRLTRTARPGHLYNSEYGLPGLSFAGAIYGQVPRLQSIESDIPKHWSFAGALLIAALRSLTRLGGGKSVGAGAVQVQFATEIDEAQQPFEIFSLNGATHRVDAWLSAIPVEVGADYELAREMVLPPQEDNHADAG